MYQFQLTEIHTEVHAHPVAEICVAQEGSFLVEANGKSYPKCTFALILPNVPHRLVGNGCTLEMSLFENKANSLKGLVARFGLRFEKGCLLLQTTAGQEAFLLELNRFVDRPKAEDNFDPRVATCLSRLQSGEVDYFNMVQDLRSHVNLSESRLSHLFKANLGISLQQYLLWNRLKSAIDLNLQNGTDLLTAALECGFYDQAHFGRTFKKMMGISPAKIYNSRIVQWELQENDEIGPRTND